MVIWEEIKGDGEYWKPTIDGEFVTGVISEMDTEADYGLAVTLTDPASILIRMPSHKVLQARLSLCKLGDLVRITYKGSQQGTKGHNPTQIYKVERAITEEKI